MSSYFDIFLPKITGQAKLDTAAFRELSDNVCTWEGAYSFQTGEDVARARFSYIMKKDADGNFKIAHHHSSLLPEEGDPKMSRQDL